MKGSGKYHNHELPAHYECYVVIVTMRGSELYIAIPFTPSPGYYEPHGENGIDIFIRSEWTDAFKIVYSNFLPTDEMRGSILRYIRKTFIPTAKFYRSIEPK